MSSRIDFTDMVQNDLTLLDYSHTHRTHAFWDIKCKCGNVFKAEATRVIYQNQKQCMKCAYTTHDLSHHPLYGRVNNMLRRYKVAEDLNDVSKLIGFVVENSDWEARIEEGCTLTRTTRGGGGELNKDNICWKEPRNGSREPSKQHCMTHTTTS